MQAMFSLASALQPFVDVLRKALFGGALRDIPPKNYKTLTARQLKLIDTNR